MSLTTIVPDWPAPDRVRALTTTRVGGTSIDPYSSLNLGAHVGDRPEAVAGNRQRLITECKLPSEPVWLEQVHGIETVDVKGMVRAARADGAWTSQAGIVCVVMTADCLPLLICDNTGNEVAALHAGWRGICNGVIEAGVARFSSPTEQLSAWLGPAIGPHAYEVGDDVRDRFIGRDRNAVSAFAPIAAGRWLADIYELARQRLLQAGVNAIYGGEFCTFSDEQRFFSHRRDGVTGRMATLIWKEAV